MNSLLTRIIDFCSHYFGGLYKSIDKNHIFLLSGGLAFSIVLCMVPFVLILIYMLGNFLESPAVSRQIDLFVDTLIPYVEYNAYVKRIIFSRADEVIAYKNIAGYIGAFGLFFAASGLFSSMRTGLNVVFESSATRRAYLGKLQDLAMVLLVMIFFLLSTAILPLLEAAGDLAGKVEFLKFLNLSFAQSALLMTGSFIMLFILFFALYTLLPDKKPGFRIPAIGAFWATLLWIAARQIFGYYIANVASIKQVYGTYMLFVVVVVWIYYTSAIFLIGAQIAQLYRIRKRNR